MTCFFTSSPNLPDDPDLCPFNGFIHELHRALPYPCRAVYVCSDPESWDDTDLYAGLMADSMEKSGFAFSFFEVLDGRNIHEAEELIRQADFIILSGGHVPTQNAFFRELGLKELLAGFDGVVLSISAGSMNSAATVYAHPELEGEALDPDYARFLPGLGLTDVNIIPHFNQIEGDTLDGLDLFEDIAIPDSAGRTFYVLPDGSYILSRDGKEELHGEAWIIRDGVMDKISEDEDVLPLN